MKIKGRPKKEKLLKAVTVMFLEDDIKLMEFFADLAGIRRGVFLRNIIVNEINNLKQMELLIDNRKNLK